MKNRQKISSTWTISMISPAWTIIPCLNAKLDYVVCKLCVPFYAYYIDLKPKTQTTFLTFFKGDNFYPNWHRKCASSQKVMTYHANCTQDWKSGVDKLGNILLNHISDIIKTIQQYSLKCLKFQMMMNIFGRCVFILKILRICNQLWNS
jgi:hypothetical protein